CLQSKTSPLTF
nr:immunoglobulin light chain junction region [Macaca mulatta]MOV76125.1 immunoglobulin light chain junction region [Macaca mulatta]